MAFVALSLLGACDRDAAPAADIARARPRIAEFERFESWAQRTLGAEPAMRGEAVESTLFAPLRLESEVRGARVERLDCRPGSARCLDVATGEETRALEWRSRRIDGTPLEVSHQEGVVGLARTRSGVRVEMLFESSPGDEQE